MARVIELQSHILKLFFLTAKYKIRSKANIPARSQSHLKIQCAVVKSVAAINLHHHHSLFFFQVNEFGEMRVECLVLDYTIHLFRDSTSWLQASSETVEDLATARGW